MPAEYVFPPAQVKRKACQIFACHLVIKAKGVLKGKKAVMIKRLSPPELQVPLHLFSLGIKMKICITNLISPQGSYNH